MVSDIQAGDGKSLTFFYSEVTLKVTTVSAPFLALVQTQDYDAGVVVTLKVTTTLQYNFGAIFGSCELQDFDVMPCSC